jgi:hypothetical protein
VFRNRAQEGRKGRGWGDERRGLPVSFVVQHEAEGARYVDLFYSSVKVLVDLGVPLPHIAPPAIETTATKVEERPAEEEPK